MSKIHKVQNYEKEDYKHLDSLNHNNDKVTTKSNLFNQIPKTKTR